MTGAEQFDEETWRKLRETAERNMAETPVPDGDLRAFAAREIQNLLSDSDLLILRTVRRHRWAMTAQGTDFETGEVYGRSTHQLVRKGLLRVTDTGKSWIIVALTDLGKRVLDA